MDLTEEHKKNIERIIVETIITALEKAQITEDDYEKMSTFILEKIENVKTHHDLVIFLRELTANWSLFSFVLTLENGEVKKVEDNMALKKVEELVNSGNLEEALQTAKQATGGQEGA
jgi:hypothetical protein